MDPWKKIKVSGTFKRNVKKNLCKIVNMNPILCQEIVHTESPAGSSSQEPNFSGVTKKIPDSLPFHRLEKALPTSETLLEWDVQDDTIDFAEPEPDDESFANLRLLTELQSWAVKNNIRQSALKDLLSILNNRLSDTLPRDPRTLLRTAQTVQISKMDNGHYWHQGVKTCIERVLSEITEPIKISLKINIDGLPVYKSSKDEFWPILINIEEFPQVQPMIVGIYAGKQKPSSIECFLTPFVDEMELVCQEGIVVNGHKVTVSIKCFICDSPARAFIKGNLHSIYAATR